MILQLCLGVMAPVLFADRFCVCAVTVRSSIWRPASRRGSGRVTFSDDQARDAWLVRSAELLECSSPTTASLLDFGAAGRAGYFDAWSGPPPTCAAAGAAVECRQIRGVRTTWACEQRDLIDRLSEVLDTGVGGRPRAVSLAVSAPIPRRTVVSVIARASRLRGYVPVSARMLHPRADPGCGVVAGIHRRPPRPRAVRHRRGPRVARQHAVPVARPGQRSTARAPHAERAPGPRRRHPNRAQAGRPGCARSRRRMPPTR